jgi:hypothetical protein
MGTVRTTPPVRQVRALHDAETIAIYQAYGPLIAEPAARSLRSYEPGVHADRRGGRSHCAANGTRYGNESG